MIVSMQSRYCSLQQAIATLGPYRKVCQPLDAHVANAVKEFAPPEAVAELVRISGRRPATPLQLPSAMVNLRERHAR